MHIKWVNYMVCELQRKKAVLKIYTNRSSCSSPHPLFYGLSGAFESSGAMDQTHSGYIAVLIKAGNPTTRKCNG